MGRPKKVAVIAGSIVYRRIVVKYSAYDNLLIA